MPLFNIPELREEARRSRTIAVSRSNLGSSDATHHLDAWAQELIAYARQLGYEVIDINGANLVYEKFTEILKTAKPRILFNFSHGCRTYLMGNDLRCTLTRGWEDPQYSCGVCGMPSNLNTISGMGIVAFSCHSAYQLGKCCVAAGSPFYIGFSDNLLVVSDQYGTQNIFRDALMPLAQNILMGMPVGVAVELTRIELLETVKKYKPVEMVSVPLYYDRKYLVLHGDPNWKLDAILKTQS